ncbi:MAG: hypothetical protein AABN33_12405 [Acidobacteriota bacterium]
MRRIFTRLAIVLLILVALVCSYVAWAYVRRPFTEGVDKPMAYTMLRDEMDTFIYIGVEPDISDKTLCATLSQAAEDHMNDRARDLLASQFFYVGAYLVRDGKQSAVRAGTLTRMVHGPKRANLLPHYLTDRFNVSLDEARRSLQ